MGAGTILGTILPLPSPTPPPGVSPLEWCIHPYIYPESEFLLHRAEVSPIPDRLRAPGAISEQTCTIVNKFSRLVFPGKVSHDALELRKVPKKFRPYLIKYWSRRGLAALDGLAPLEYREHMLRKLATRPVRFLGGHSDGSMCFYGSIWI